MFSPEGSPSLGLGGPLFAERRSWGGAWGGASGTGLAAMHCLASPPGRLNPEGVDSQQVLRRSRSDANRPSDKKTGGAALRRRSVLARPSPPGRLSQMQRDLKEGVDSQQVLRRSRSDANRPSDMSEGLFL